MEFVRVATLDSNVHGKELSQIILVPKNHFYLDQMLIWNVTQI